MNIDRTIVEKNKMAARHEIDHIKFQIKEIEEGLKNNNIQVGYEPWLDVSYRGAKALIKYIEYLKNDK